MFEHTAFSNSSTPRAHAPPSIDPSDTLAKMLEGKIVTEADARVAFAFLDLKASGMHELSALAVHGERSVWTRLSDDERAPDKWQKTYTLEQYRKDWTKNAPELVAAGKLDTTEHRTAYVEPDLKMIDATYKMAGHVGSWH